MPKYFGKNNHDEILLENLLTGMGPCSIIDIKIGTSTATLRCKDDKAETDRINQKDLQTTSNDYGFAI